MTITSTGSGGRESARSIPVWDPLARLVHCTLALAILLNATTLEGGSAIHEWVGYVALAPVGIRLLCAIIGPSHARFTAFPPNPMRAVRNLRGLLRGDGTVHLSHNPLGALMVHNIWLSVIAIGLTGCMMTTFAFFGVDWVETVHEAVFIWLLLSVALHGACVAFDTWRSGVNLGRAMVCGRNVIPEGHDVE